MSVLLTGDTQRSVDFVLFDEDLTHTRHIVMEWVSTEMAEAREHNIPMVKTTWVTAYIMHQEVHVCFLNSTTSCVIVDRRQVLLTSKALVGH